MVKRVGFRSVMADGLNAQLTLNSFSESSLIPGTHFESEVEVPQ